MTIYATENEGYLIQGATKLNKTDLQNLVWEKAYGTVLKCLCSPDLTVEGFEQTFGARDNEQSRALKRSFYGVCVRYCADSGVARNWDENVLTGFHPTIQAQRRISATNHCNHLAKYEVYLGRFIHYCLQAQDGVLGPFMHLFQRLTRKQYDFVFGRIMAVLREEEGTSINIVLKRTRERSRQGIPEEVWDALEYFLSDFLLPNFYNKEIRDFDCQTRSVKLYEILQVLEVHGQARQLLAQERRERVEAFSNEDVNTLFSISEFKDLREKAWKGKNAEDFRTLFDNRQIAELYSQLRQKKERDRKRLSRAEKIAYKVINRFVRERNAANGLTWRERRQHKWAFDLCPQASYRPKYMSISSSGLKQMVTHLAHHKDEGVKDALERVKNWHKEDIEYMMAHGIDTESKLAKHLLDFRYWDEFFNLRRVMKNSYPELPRDLLRQHYQNPDLITGALAKRFGNSISTDGYGTSVLLEKLKEGIDREICTLNFRIGALNKKKASERTMEESEELQQLKDQREQLELDQKEQMYKIPRANGLTVKHVLRQKDMDDLQSLANRWNEESSRVSVKCRTVVRDMLVEFKAAMEQVRQGDPEEDIQGERIDFDARRFYELAKIWIERDVSDMGQETDGQVHRMGVEMLSLLEKVQIYETNRVVIGIDMGKRNVLTAAYHDTSLQKVHMSNVKTDEGGRFKTVSRTNGKWRVCSGQITYSHLMKKRISKFVPNLGNRPTTKTTNTGTIMQSYRFVNVQWENGTDATSNGGLKKAFFSTNWYRKQKMIQYSKRQKAIAKFVMLVLKAGDDEQELSLNDAKKIIVAYGDSCPSHNVKGVAPAPNMPFYRKFKELATCVLVDEHRTSMNCSCCIEKMDDGEVFGLKRCSNDACVRETWNRDTNAAINMFNLLLWKTLYGDRPRTFSRN
jgi:hypothetical protein